MTLSPGEKINHCLEVSPSIDARDTRSASWDGRVTVDFTVKDGAASSKDSVMLRVAPVLLHHHLQQIQKVFTSSFEGMRSPEINYMQDIIGRVEDSMQRAQVAGPVTQLATQDPWAQDYFEPGYMSMPGPDGGAVSVRLVMEGRHSSKRNSTGLIYTTLRGDNVGGIAAHPPSANLYYGDSTYSAGGNMEMLPPYEHNGVKFPAGRVIVGGDDKNQPQNMDFLTAQELQAPALVLWLSIKHVDEMLQAVPAKTARGWAIIAMDPQLGLGLLRVAQENGLGDQPVISGNKTKSGPTIAEFVKTSTNVQAADISARRMTANMELLKKETGITDAEIFRVPALIAFGTVVAGYLGPQRRRRRDTETRDEAAALRRRQAYASGPVPLDSLLPSLVNGVPLNESHYMAPKPFGPLVGGRDLFETFATSQYEKAGFTTVEFVDEWSIHETGGDLHCFSNTFRDASEPWWSK